MNDVTASNGVPAAAEPANGARRPESPQAPARRRVTLHGSTSARVTLPAALAAAGMRAGVALLASADAYRVARLLDGHLVTAAEPAAARTAPDEAASVAGALTMVEEPVPLAAGGPAGVFEARVFDGAAELRWLCEAPDGTGTAVLLGEDEAVASRLAEPLAPREAIDRIEQRYLLWGTGLDTARAGVAAVPTGWARLAESRVGVLTVPVDGPPPGVGESVYLHAVEYVGLITTGVAAGNAAVVEERLVRLAGDVPRVPARHTGGKP